MNEEEKNSLLIVDDENLNLKVLTRILGSDYKIYTAANGISAIEKAMQYMPDLILLDILMPEMNGYQTISELKANEKTHRIPVIFITGLVSFKDEEKGLDMGAADFIHKPFSAKVVKSRVRNQIQIVNQIRAIELYVKVAEDANRAKSAFLAKMSHEIRTPMNAILGIAEIQLQNENISPDIKEALNRIMNSGSLLLGIINDILDISRIEAGKLQLIQTKYDVAGLINDTAFLNIIKYENKPIDFTLNVDENIPSMLFGDELRIKQVLNNLLSNAFKYTDAGEVELSFEIENPPASADDVVTLIFRVRDTGQGMTAEQVGKLGDDYSRFNLQTNRTTEGIGLGMSITRSLIKTMKGEIFLESEPGKGSLFTVRLPQGNAGAPALGSITAESLRTFGSYYTEKTKKTMTEREPVPFGKVLVVDDLELNLYVVKGKLLPYGLHIDTATSGFEAIEKVKNNVYDIVFMDYMMPKMDGVEAAREIRKLGREYEKLPIIAITANAVSGVREKLLESGFNGFISKPIDTRELDEMIRKWIPPCEEPV
jgi:signal transduction histidine kinase